MCHQSARSAAAADQQQQMPAGQHLLTTAQLSHAKHQDNVSQQTAADH
jgi:hypothetical protein